MSFFFLPIASIPLRRGFLAKKRARSAEKEKVDKAIGTDSDYLSEEDFLGLPTHRQHQQRHHHPRHHHHQRRPHPRNFGYYGGGASSASDVASDTASCCCCGGSSRDLLADVDDDYPDDGMDGEGDEEEDGLLDDSVSQISAMDSASQTGGSMVEGGSRSDRMKTAVSPHYYNSIGKILLPNTYNTYI